MKLRRAIACVASVSSRGSSRKLGQEQKNIFCFRSTFRGLTRLETLATQASRASAGGRTNPGGIPKKVLYGDSPPQGPTPFPFIHHFGQKRCPFPVPSIDKRYPFHISSLELGIPFNCCKCTVFEI